MFNDFYTLSSVNVIERISKNNLVNVNLENVCALCRDKELYQGGHGTGKTGNLVLTFSRQGKHREFCCNTGKIFETQGKYF